MNASRIELHGVLGDALAANLRGRLSHFIVDRRSPAIALFAPSHRAENAEGDWYGEHAGKWLYAAAKAVARSGDRTLAARVREVADYLLSVQEADGYLGTYQPARRFMRPQPPRPVSWDGAPALRTWDIWVHAYLILGLIEASRTLAETRYLDAAARIGELCRRTIVEHGLDATTMGNHFGMSATVLIDPACELYFATGQERYLELAERVLAQADAEPRLALLRQALSGADASEIGTGKAYQLCWNLVGIAKLYRATGKHAYRDAVLALWRNIRDHHLSLGGGPFGGVGHRSREVFNPAHVFSPYGYVETCSTLAWIQLNRELLAITGAAHHAEEIERSAYNDLLAAQAPDGEDWCYYVFSNGRRVHTTYWRCCKSSGAMALEELTGMAWDSDGRDTVTAHLLGPGHAEFDLRGERVRVAQDTRYPHEGSVRLRIEQSVPGPFTMRVRVPSWAHGATLCIPDGADQTVAAGGYGAVSRVWAPGDVLELRLPMRVRVHHAVHRNVQESRAPDGSPVAQEVFRAEWIALSRGPLAYATTLIDGYKTEESLLLPDEAESAAVRAEAGRGPNGACRLWLAPLRRTPIPFDPWYDLAGRRDGSWRLTWMPLAPESAETKAEP